MRALVDLVTAVLALALVALGLWPLVDATRGLEVERTRVGATPVTVFREAGAPPAPVVVIAHGFAGSQQLMQPFALTLARSGYVAVTFDFLGHGDHPEPLGGDLGETAGATRHLVDQLAEVAAFARGLPASDGRLAVLGHSMATDLIVRFAQGEAAGPVAAVVGVSLRAPTATATSPANLLIVVGAWEPGLVAEAFRTVGLAVEGEVEAGVTYGDLAAGTARRVVPAPNVEHIGVLYSPTSVTAARDWLNAAFARDRAGEPEVRGPAIGWLFLGLVLLARPLAHRLPKASDRPLGASLPWRRLWLVILLPMLATPLLLRLVPVSFLPIVVGDYLVLHFALYGALTFLALVIATRGRAPLPPAHVRWGRLLLGAALLALYSIVVFGLPIDLYVTSFWPTAERLPLVLAMLAGTLPYFVADEWATRGERVPRGAYAATKLAFVVSLALAVALDFERLFFLVMIVPVILVFFVIYGLFSGWAERRTGHPLTGGIANAVAFAWAIAVTFPMATG